MQDGKRRRPSISVQALKRGDKAEWERFFAEYDATIVRIVSWPKWRFEPDLQSDVCQSIRGAVIEAVTRLRDDAQLLPFLKQICVHHCISALRRQVRDRERHVRLAGDAAAEEVSRCDPVALIVAAEQFEALRRLMQALDPDCRTIITQFYAEGRSYREIASLHGVAVNTVGSRLARCLEKLRRLMPREPVFRDCDDRTLEG